MVLYDIQMKSGKAKLVLHQKLTCPSGHIEELKVWKVPVTKKYPEGIKYRLVLVEPKAKEVLVLFDNHHPKGHHLHLDGEEKPYRYLGVRQLLIDFRAQADRARRK